MACTELTTIAIDLGTANIRAGIFHRNEYKIFSECGSRSDAIPSYVAFTHSEVLVGESALNQLSENPSNTVYDITRLLGRYYSDTAIQNCMIQWPFKVIHDVQGKAMVSVQFKGRELQLTPEEICSILLKRIRKIAESTLKCRVTSVVIAIPVCFNYTQRLAVKHAAFIAGFNVTKLINAPVAAAVFHGPDIIQKSNTAYNIPIFNVKVPNYYSVEYKIAIFDLGAGTLDISVVNVTEGACTVLATAGDIHLGGNEIDNQIVDHFVNTIKVERDRDISTNDIAMSRLRVGLERAKIDLSQSEIANVEIPKLCEGINFKGVITKTWLEQLSKPTFLNCIDIMVTCLREAGISRSDMINSVILLGGSTKFPLLRRLIRDYFAENNNILYEAEELAVTFGTSVLACELNSEKEKSCYMELIDATPVSLGIKAVKGDFEAVIVPKNTQIPKTVGKQIYYRHYNQQNTCFQVYEVKGKYSPGPILLSNLQLYGKKSPAFKIECKYYVWFEIEVDGVLNVTIEDTCCRIHNTVRISSNLLEFLPTVKESKQKLLQLEVLGSTEEHNVNMEIVVESSNQIAEKKEIVEQKELAIGIDLGTTNCCVGVWRRNRVEIIANEYGNRATLSSVSFTEKERLIGDAAKQQMIMNPANSIINVKRLMGRRNLDVKTLPFKVNETANGRTEIVVQYKGEEKLFAPEEITAMMLRKIKEQAEEHTKTEIKKAVITVPACFNQSQRKATWDAGRIAGLNVMQLLNEPTAAAITYYLHKSSLESFDKKNVLVFDLGGGTFDVSVVRISNGKIQVSAVLGDSNLGGEDFDTNMVDFMVDFFVQQFNKKKAMKGKNLRDNPKSLRRLRVACEKAKRVLSTVPKTKIDLDALYEGIDLSTTITKEKFEALNKDLIERLLEIMKRCLQNARMDRSEIDDVVLVGGSTRIPLLQQELQSFFEGKELYKSINQDEAVAYGAAIQAAKLSGNNSKNFQGFEIHDVTSLSLGMKTTGGAMHLLAPRYSIIPFAVEQIFTTCKNNQSEIPISMYECESFGVNSNEGLMGKFEVCGIPPQPRGSSKVCVNLNIDSSGILNLSAKPYDMDDSGSKAISIKEVESPNLTEKEIEGMKSSAEKFKADDLEQKKQAEELNALENFALGMTKIANDPNVGAMKKSQIEGAVAETLNWLEEHHNAKIEEIGKKKQELESLCNQENDEKMQELESLCNQENDEKKQELESPHNQEDDMEVS